MKICVYAICKNEEKFIDRYMDSMSEADKVFVLDTGSMDASVEKLKKRGAIVKEAKIEPFRFDKARNLSLDMVDLDADLCVCTDLDEVFEKGWRKKLEQVYKKGMMRIRYPYIWNFNEYNQPGLSFYLDKIHVRKGYKWVYPVHEVLKRYKDEKEYFGVCDNIVLKHYADNTKSRAFYLPLLELAVKEDKKDDRNRHYLGREYMFRGMYEKAIKTLKAHLRLKRATWKEERAASMRFIARCYFFLKKNKLAKRWYKKAILEVDWVREGYTELGMLYYKEKNYKDAISYLEQALKIIKKSNSYINEAFCFDGTIEDILSVCYFYKGDKEKAFWYVNKALLLKKEDKRILENKKIIEESLLER